MAGDRTAFDLLAGRCRLWLFGLCLRLTRDRTAAEDLVQETLLLAWRDLRQLREPGRFHAWLSRIAVNACRMHLRGLSVRPQEGRVHVQRESLSECRGGPVWPPAELEAPLGADEALAQVDDRSRRLLMLYYGEELSHAEIAEVLGLSAAAVKSRLHRARERLRKEMLAMMTEKQKRRLGVAKAAPWKLRTVLLVEPDAKVRASLRKGLTGAGFKVLTLRTGEAALAAIAQRRGQMLLLDKHCVEPNWIEVLTLVQADAWSRENVPVGVIIDHPGNERDVFLAWHAGAVLCLSRPPSAEELVNYVKRVGASWTSDESLRPPRHA